MQRDPAGTSGSTGGRPSSFPFSFLRHGVGLADTLRLWVLVEDPAGSARLVADGFTAWARSVKLAPTVRVEGPGAVLSAGRWKVACGWRGLGDPRASSPALAELELTPAERQALPLHAALDAVLLEAHREAPLGLVVRENKVRASPWHDATMGDVGRLLAALAALTRLPGPYVKDHAARRATRTTANVSDILLATSRGSVAAELFAATMRVLQGSAATFTQREVLHDVLVELLPAWLGFDFDLDVVLRETLSAQGGTAPEAITMPTAFHEEVARRMGQRHRTAEAREPGPSRVDWSRAADVLAHFDPTLPAHVQTLLSFTHARRLELVAHGRFATRLANAAVFRMMAGDFPAAHALYDAAVEGALDPMDAANPLYAAQDDNHHLGVDAARSYRYLERCLPHGPDNPTIYLNAAGVFMELGEPREALRMLGLAKAGGVAVRAHRNERLFAALRDEPVFQWLMR
jgi:hypothetical protein